MGVSQGIFTRLLEFSTMWYLYWGLLSTHELVKISHRCAGSTKVRSERSSSANPGHFNWGFCGRRMCKVCYWHPSLYFSFLRIFNVYHCGNHFFKKKLSIAIGNQLGRYQRAQILLFWSSGKQQAKALRSKWGLALYAPFFILRFLCQCINQFDLFQQGNWIA